MAKQRNLVGSSVLAKLGPNLKKFRQRRGYTQRQLAEKVGVTRVYMGYLEQQRERPSLKLLAELAQQLRVKIEDFFK